MPRDARMQIALNLGPSFLPFLLLSACNKRGESKKKEDGKSPMQSGRILRNRVRVFWIIWPSS